jgi:hypothetical protein
MSDFFLFMDESYSRDIPDYGPIYSLTGILVQTEKYADLRTEVYGLLEPRILQGTQIRFPPPIHGSHLLPGESDEIRIELVNSLCSLVQKHSLRIYRSAYYHDKALRRLAMSALSLCFMNVLHFISGVAADSMIWPVMELSRDDAKQELQFSMTVRALDIARQAGLATESVSMPNSNHIGEVFYATRQHSVLANLVDVVAYLRLVKDVSVHIPASTLFEKALLAAAVTLEPAIGRERLDKLEIHTS